jgi:transposase-like protein
VLELLNAGRSVTEVAADLGVSSQPIYTWRRRERIDADLIASVTSTDYVELIAARRCIAQLEAEPAVARRAAELLRETVSPRRRFEAIAVIAEESLSVQLACRPLEVTRAGSAAYGWCQSHSRYFWGFRLYLLCAADWMPIAFELAPANAPERVVAAEMLAGVDLDGYTVMADKGFAGEEFEKVMAGLGARFLRPDRTNEPQRNGSLAPVRQWIGSVIWTCKGQLTLEHHGGRTLPVCVRVALRLLALAAGLVHNQEIGNPGRHFVAYGH